MADFTSFLADMDQVAYVRSAELTEGDGRGCRIIDVFNGSGLAFTVAPDRGMNIVECSYRGIPVAFRTPSGHVAPGKFGPEDWLRNWEGGLLTSCGLRHAGPPEEGETLHGRISGASASQVCSRGAWRDGVYELTVSGILREASMFGENLRLARTIRTAYRENSITVSDEVTNCSGAPDFLLMLYHCNFGWPLVSPSVRVEAEEHEIIPRTPEAAAGMERWREMPEPVVGGAGTGLLSLLPRRGLAGEPGAWNPGDGRTGGRVAVSGSVEVVRSEPLRDRAGTGEQSARRAENRAGKRARPADRTGRNPPFSDEDFVQRLLSARSRTLRFSRTARAAARPAASPVVTQSPVTR